MTRDGAFTTQDGSAGITEGFEHPAKMPRFDRARKTEDFRRTLRRVSGWEEDYCRPLMCSRIKSDLCKENTRSKIGWLAPLGS